MGPFLCIDCLMRLCLNKEKGVRPQRAKLNKNILDLHLDCADIYGIMYKSLVYKDLQQLKITVKLK